MLIERKLKKLVQKIGDFELNELREYIKWALDDFNSHPPVTTLKLSEMDFKQRKIVLKRALGFCLFSIEMELTVQNGVPEKLTMQRQKLIAQYNRMMINKKDFYVLRN